MLHRKAIGSWEINSSIKIDRNFYGGKAEGLLKTPLNWTLPFLILTENFYLSWLSTRESLNVLDGFTDADRSAVNHFFKSCLPKDCQVYVRSNSPIENIIASSRKIISGFKGSLTISTEEFTNFDELNNKHSHVVLESAKL